jgi:hypothetical protein
MLIRDRLGDLEALNQETLDDVVTLAVAEFVKRPDDATQVEVAIDDGRVSKRYSSGKGKIEILDEWWSRLDPGLDASGAFSVRPHFEPDRCGPEVSRL